MQSRFFSVPKWAPSFLRALGSVPMVMAVVISCSDGSSPTPPVDDDDDPPPPTFPTLQGVIDQMAETSGRFPAIAQMVDLTSTYGTPHTHGGRSIYAIKISDNVAQEEDEPVFLIVAGYHGNEIGGPVVALDAMIRLTEGYGTDATISQLVDEYEIWIAPVWNVDNYPDTRKNRRPGGAVDLNRNYPFLWDSDCSGSTNTSSGSYKGPSPASEPETQTMMAFSEDQRFTKVLDFHTSGRIVVYGYRCSPHQLTDYLEAEAIALAEASSYGGKLQ
jgi:carboxypeptidase T